MFLYKTSSWLDKYDPYWYSRLFGFKAIYLCVIGFAANLLISPPFAPLVLLVSSAGALVSELPPLNNFRKKDLVFLGYLIVQLFTIDLFGATVFIPWLFVVVAFVWCYLLYSALSKAPQLFAIVSIWLMIGLVSLEAVNTGNWIVLLNLNLYIFEFACIFFFASKLMPNLYYNVWLSTKLRALDDMISAFSKKTESHPILFKNLYHYKHTSTAEQVLPLLSRLKSFSKISQFDHDFDVFCYSLNSQLNGQLIGQLKNSEIGSIDTDLISRNLLALRVGVANHKKVVVFSDTKNSVHGHEIQKLIQSWNQLC